MDAAGAWHPPDRDGSLVSPSGLRVGGPHPPPPRTSLGFFLPLAGPFDRRADRLGRMGRHLALHSGENLKMSAEVILEPGDRSLTILHGENVDQGHHLTQRFVITPEGIGQSRVVSCAR